MTWPFVKNEMEQAPRGGGSGGTSGGGKPTKKDLPYSPPKGPIQSPKGTNHGTKGSQHCK